MPSFACKFRFGPLVVLAIGLAALPVAEAVETKSKSRKEPAPVEFRLKDGAELRGVVVDVLADGVRLKVPTSGGAEPSKPDMRFVAWGRVDLDWFALEKPFKVPRGISSYGGERLSPGGVWVRAVRDESASTRDTVLRMTLRRTMGVPADELPVELETLFLQPEVSGFTVVTRRIDPLALPLAQSIDVWCAPKSPLLHQRHLLPPPVKSYKRPQHWLVRVRSHREVIAWSASDPTVEPWARTALLPDPVSPFSGVWKNYGQ